MERHFKRHVMEERTSTGFAGRCLSTILLFLAFVASMQMPAPAQEPTVSANRQFAAAARLQEIGSYDVALSAWERFLADYPNESRRDMARYNLGVCAYQEGDLNKAAAAFNVVVKDFPGFELADAAYLYLGLTQYELARNGDASKLKEAGQTFRQLITKFPKSEYLPDAEYYYAESGYMLGEKEWAAQQYGKWLQKHQQSELRTDTLYAYGVTLEEINKPSEAGTAYATFLKEYPKHELAKEVGFRLGETLFLAEKYDEALKYFDAASKDTQFALADYATLRKAEAMARLGDLKGAADLYAAIPGRFPRSPHVNRARLSAGKCYYLDEDFTSARKHLTDAYNAGGETQLESLHLIAQCLLRQGAPREAAAFVARELPKVQNDQEKTAELLLDQADAYYETPDDRENAEKLYATIGERFPQHASARQAMYMAAFSAFERGSYDDASRYADGFLARYSNGELLADVLHIAAETALQRDEPAKAETFYTRAIKTAPESENAPLWRVRQGETLVAQGKTSEATQALSSAIVELTDTDLRAQAQFLLGDCHFREGQFAKASEQLEAAIKSQAKNGRTDEIRFLLSESYLKQDRHADVQTTLKQLIATSPSSPLLDRAHFRLGESHHASGDLDSAANEYRTVASKHASSALAPDALYELACIEMARGDAKSANSALTSFLGKHANHPLAPRAHYVRGQARYKQKDYRGAIDDINASLAKLPRAEDRADATYILGLSHLGLEQFDEAAAALSRLLKESPSYAGAADARYQLAWALKLAGKDDESLRAMQALATSEAETPLAAEAQYHIGQAAYEKEDFAAAAKAFQTAADGADNETIRRNALHKLGWALYRQNDLKGAIDAFHKQVIVAPGGGALEADALFMAAECLFSQEKYGEALTEYDKLKLDSLSNDDYKAIALLHAGQSAAHGGDWKASERRLAQFLQDHPNAAEKPTALYELGWAKQNLGDKDEATRIYKQVIDTTDTEPAARAQFMIGEIQFERKEHSEAVQSYFNVLYGYGYPTWQANAAYEAARCFEVLKKPTQAKKLYEELTQKFPASDKAPLAKQRLQELNRQ